jgi:glycosyltransferase involved in cell wall biosynthesis
MRILSVTAGLNRGGSERAAQNFSTAYRALGHDVAVLVWKEDGCRRQQLEAAGVEVFDGIGRLDRALGAAGGFNPDVIHIHRVGIARAIETYVLERLRTGGRRVIETNIFGRADDSDGARLIDVHMHLSAWCLWRWQKWLGHRAAQPIGVVVPNPVDGDAFAPAPPQEVAALRAKLGVPQDAYLCGRIGQKSGPNWHRQIFDAFARLAQLDAAAHLLLVGLPDALRPALDAVPPDARRRIVELELTDRDTELSTAYSALDCFIHAASFGESFGYVLTEAMLCECPVVTASTPHVNNSQVEVVGHLSGGVVAGSIKALGDAVVSLWSRPSLRRDIKARLRQHVLRRFEARHVAATAVEIATLALDTGDRRALRRRIAERPELRSHVSDDEMRRLLSHTLGRPRFIELAEMRLRHTSAVQRAIDRRLTRRLERAEAALV